MSDDLPPLPPCPNYPPRDVRDARGRFAAGNPGKLPGTKRRVTIRVEELFEGDVEAVTQSVLNAARKGDMIAARIILDRVAPIRRGRHVHINNFPVIEKLTDLPRAHAALIAAVAAGEVTADEAAPLSALLTAFSNSLDQAALAARLDELERRIEEAKHPDRMSPEEQEAAARKYAATLTDDGA